MIRKRHVMGIAGGGLIAATLDIIYAMIMTTLAGYGPLAAMRGVASGLIGSAAFQEGIATAALGLLLHCMILIVAAAIYYAASRRLPPLRNRAVICGLLFGVLVYLFMHFVVVPLSAVPFTMSHTPWKLLQGFASHGILVGLPIALMIRRFSDRKN
ncbi:MAG TPA: hypothetical protein VFX02_06120 [Gammaproteobacteria bacterium]|nr:hypothetical protein [Gammaproteobacteria bacterium]